MKIRQIAMALAITLGSATSATAAPFPAGPAGGETTPADQTAKPLVGTFRDAEAWRAYRARFVSASGRIIDTANRGVSHSEGQGYGMLLAVAANDRATFDLIWGWTRANLMVRDDELLAWRWEPNQRPAVADMNDASDGDILVAWALTEAAEAWGSLPYRIAARRIAVEVGRKLVIPRTASGTILLPGVMGFAAEDRPDGPVINLSYWVFPALARLPLVAPDVDWAGLSRDGMQLVKAARFGPASLPTEWISLHDGTPRPADGFEKTFAYNSIRIPLYIAWAGLGQREVFAPFVSIWQARGRLPIVDAATGRPTDWLIEHGYLALAALTSCASAGKRLPADTLRIRADENYYAVTLNMLAVIAARTRYPTCFAD